MSQKAPPPDAGADGPGPPPPDPETGGEAAHLPPRVEDLLVLLAKALQHYTFYPPDHPALDPVLDEVVDAAGEALDGRDHLELAVAPDRVVLEEGETDPGQPLLRSLAQRLHQHDVARVDLSEGVEPYELSDFLREAATQPDGEAGPLGGRPEVAETWPNIVLQPVRYERLSLTDAEEAGEHPEELEADVEDLWTGLARAALSEAALEELEEDQLPSVQKMVSALRSFTGDRSRARAAAARMVALSGKIEAMTGAEAARSRERYRELVDALGARETARLLNAVPAEQRKDFMENTADWLPAETLLEILGDVADEEELNVSYHMLRLLSRLAGSLEEASLGEDGARDPEAEAAFREQIRALVAGWKDNVVAPGPDVHLRGPRRSASAVLWSDRGFVEPERVVQTALEVDLLGPVGRQAATRMVEEGLVVRLLELLREAPPGDEAAPAVWEHLDLGRAIRDLLDRDPPDFDAVDEVVERVGPAAVGPLLDTLSQSESRSTRRQLFSRLAEMEGDVEDEMVRRLDDERWFVKRNMLALLVERGRRPPGFSALPFTRHSRPEVRREAYKLACTDPDDRPEALRRGLEEEDDKTLTLVLGALEDADPATLDELVPLIRRCVEERRLSPELLQPAVRALGRAERDDALETLLDLCQVRKLWKFWTVEVAERSALVLAALKALHRGWGDRASARKILEQARASSDPEVREAAGGGGASRDYDTAARAEGGRR